MSSRAGLLHDDLRLGAVRLRVTDRDRAVAFYRDVIGLTWLGETDDRIAQLGTPDGAVVVELAANADLQAAGRHAGLYHVALLYPSRPELARAIERIAMASSPVQGASDHGTHEAIYLADPDGNGLELAVDRPRDDWPESLANVESIRPQPLDLANLLETVADDERVPARASDGLRVGHLHLHVGDIAQATTYYVDAVGFDAMTMLDVAGFVSAGGYHHHLGYNTWQGVGVGPAPKDVVGLDWWSVVLPTTDELDALESRLRAAKAVVERPSPDLLVTRDPWGTELRVHGG